MFFKEKARLYLCMNFVHLGADDRQKNLHKEHWATLENECQCDEKISIENERLTHTLL